MVREIMRDPVFLSLKAEPADETDLGTAMDLLDTLKANSERCVGMAANMIGVPKRIIAVNDNGRYLLMLNPELIRKKVPYDTEEGCLSLSGTRKTRRFTVIRVSYMDEKLVMRQGSFTGFTAQIIQHELDHCDGILI